MAKTLSSCAICFTFRKMYFLIHYSDNVQQEHEQYATLRHEVPIISRRSLSRSKATINMSIIMRNIAHAQPLLKLHRNVLLYHPFLVACTGVGKHVLIKTSCRDQPSIVSSQSLCIRFNTSWLIKNTRPFLPSEKYPRKRPENLPRSLETKNLGWIEPDRLDRSCSIHNLPK